MNQELPDRIEFQKPEQVRQRGGQVVTEFASARPPMRRKAKVAEGQNDQIIINDEQQRNYTLTIELPFDTAAGKVDNTWRIIHTTRVGNETLNINGIKVVENGRHPKILIAATLDR